VLPLPRFDAALRSRSREELRRSQGTIFHGIFGGFAAYDYVVCTRLRPIMAVLNELDYATWRDRREFPFAGNYRGDRVFSADDGDATVTVDGEAAAPEGPGAFGRWFATYARRVASRCYRVAKIVPDMPGTDGVVLFPDGDDGPDCAVSEAVTRGIRARASALYLPAHQSGFAYSIRLRRVDDSAPPTCQLKSRKWHIRDGDDAPRDVVGDGAARGCFKVTSTLWSGGARSHGSHEPRIHSLRDTLKRDV